MCLGSLTASLTANAPDSSTDAVTAGTTGHWGLAGNVFCHTTYAEVVTTNSSANTSWTINAAKAVPVPTTVTGAGYAAQTIVAGPSSCTTMKGVTTYGATTLTPATDAAFFDSTIAVATVAAAGLSTNVLSTSDSVTAVFNMPKEADTYADVPRLSPADPTGWVAYAPDVTASASYGKNILQLSPTQAAITTAFATTLATGVAAVGAVALSF